MVRMMDNAPDRQRDGGHSSPELYSKSSPIRPSSPVHTQSKEMFPSTPSSLQSAHRRQYFSPPRRGRQHVSSPSVDRHPYRPYPRFTRNDQGGVVSIQKGFSREIDRPEETDLTSRLAAVSPPPLRRQSPSRPSSSVPSSHRPEEATAPWFTRRDNAAGMDFGAKSRLSTKCPKRTTYAVPHVFLSAEDNKASKPEYVKNIRGFFKTYRPDKIEWDIHGFYVLFPQTLEGRNRATQAAKLKDILLFGKWPLKPVLCMPKSQAQQSDRQKRQSSATEQTALTCTLPHVHVVFDQIAPRSDLLQDVNDAFKPFGPHEIRPLECGFEVLFPATAKGRDLAKSAAQRVNGTCVRNSNCIRTKYNEVDSSTGDQQQSGNPALLDFAIRGRAASRQQQSDDSTCRETEPISLAPPFEPKALSASPVSTPARAISISRERLDHPLNQKHVQSDDTSSISGATSSSRSKFPKCHVCKALGGTLIQCSSSECRRRYHRHCLSHDAVWDPQNSIWQCDRCERKVIPHKRLASEALEVSHDAVPVERLALGPAKKRTKTALTNCAIRSNEATTDHTECSVEPIEPIHRSSAAAAEHPELFQQSPVSAVEWSHIFNLDEGLFLIARGRGNNQLSADERLLHERIMHTGWRTWKDWHADASTLLELAPPTRLWATFARMRTQEIRALAFKAQRTSYDLSPDLDRENHVRDALNVFRMHVIPGIEEQEWIEQHRREQRHEAIVGGLLGNIVTLQFELTGLRARHKTPPDGTKSQLRWDRWALVEGRSSLPREDTSLIAWVDARINALTDRLDEAQKSVSEENSGTAKLPWIVAKGTRSPGKPDNATVQASPGTLPTVELETLDATVTSPASLEPTASLARSKDTGKGLRNYGPEAPEKSPPPDLDETHDFSELDGLVDKSFSGSREVEKAVSGRNLSIKQLVKRKPRPTDDGSEIWEVNGENISSSAMPAGSKTAKQTIAAHPATSTHLRSAARSINQAETTSKVSSAFVNPAALKSKQSVERASDCEAKSIALRRLHAEQLVAKQTEHATLSYNAPQPRTGKRGPIKGRRTKPETFKCTSCKKNNVQKGPLGRTVCMDCRDRASKEIDPSRLVSKPSSPGVSTEEHDVSPSEKSLAVPNRIEPLIADKDGDGRTQSDAFTNATIETNRLPPSYRRSVARLSALTSIETEAMREQPEDLTGQLREKSALLIGHPNSPPKLNGSQPRVAEDSSEAGIGSLKGSQDALKQNRSRQAPSSHLSPKMSIESDTVPYAQPEKKTVTRVQQRVLTQDRYDLGDSLTRPKGTYRRLIALALCAAPGHRATPSQVVQWIADNVPGYDLKLGSWASGVRASMIMNVQGKLGEAVASVTTAVGVGRRYIKIYELLPGIVEEVEQWDTVLQHPVLSKASQHDPEAGESPAAYPDEIDGNALGVDHCPAPGDAAIDAPVISEDTLGVEQCPASGVATMDAPTTSEDALGLDYCPPSDNTAIDAPAIDEDALCVDHCPSPGDAAIDAPKISEDTFGVDYCPPSDNTAIDAPAIDKDALGVDCCPPLDSAAIDAPTISEVTLGVDYCPPSDKAAIDAPAPAISEDTLCPSPGDAAIDAPAISEDTLGVDHCPPLNNTAIDAPAISEDALCPSLGDVAIDTPAISKATLVVDHYPPLDDTAIDAPAIYEDTLGVDYCPPSDGAAIDAPAISEDTICPTLCDAVIGALGSSEDTSSSSHDAVAQKSGVPDAPAQDMEATQGSKHSRSDAGADEDAAGARGESEKNTNSCFPDLNRPREPSDKESSGKASAEETDEVWTTTRSLYEEWPDLLPKAPFDVEAKLAEIASRPTRKQRLATRLAHPPFEPVKTLRPRSSSSTSAVPVIQHSSPAELVYADDGSNIVHFDSVDEFLGITEDLEVCVLDRELAFKPANSSRSLFFKTGIAM